MEILESLKKMPDITEDEDVLKEYIAVISDRLCLRLGTEKLPAPFQSICVDATVKMCRRTYYEGISSEGAASISTSFVEDILKEYAPEIADWKEREKEKTGKVVKFL